ncbi:MAG: hypothetical protein ACRC62_31650 [Microcoleus sp.]
MAQYFYFCNSDTQEVSTYLIPFDVSDGDRVIPSQNPDFDAPFARNLDSAQGDQWETFFNWIRNTNEWSMDQPVVAVGDYGDLIFDYGSIGWNGDPEQRFCEGFDDDGDFAWVPELVEAGGEI